MEYKWEKRFGSRDPLVSWLLVFPVDHLEELFVNPASTIHYCYRAWQDGFQGIPTTFHL